MSRLGALYVAQCFARRCVGGQCPPFQLSELKGLGQKQDRAQMMDSRTTGNDCVMQQGSCRVST